MGIGAMIAHAIATVAMTVGISACGETVTYFDTGEIVKNDDTNIVYVSPDYETFDANPGDTVILILSPANYPDSKTDCADMGGTFQTSNSIDYCVDIDF